MKLMLPFAIASVFFVFISCRSKKPWTEEYMEGPVTREVIGTVCNINLYAQGTAGKYEELFDCLRNIENTFSVNIPDSEVSRINEKAGISPVAVSADVMEVVDVALSVANISSGKFDPTVGPLVKLWGIGTENQHVPSAEEIESAKAKVDYRKVVLDKEKSTVFLKDQGMMLDLGGIAKGYAADELARLLESMGIHHAMVNLGGNVYVYGTKPDQEPWYIGVRNPEGWGGVSLVLSMTEPGSIVTSGICERNFYEDGRMYHHILDVETGCPAENDLLSISVMGKSSLWCDAWSTAAFMMGPEEFGPLARKFGLKFIFINKRLQVLASKGLEAALEPCDEEYSDISYF